MSYVIKLSCPECDLHEEWHERFGERGDAVCEAEHLIAFGHGGCEDVVLDYRIEVSR